MPSTVSSVTLTSFLQQPAPRSSAARLCAPPQTVRPLCQMTGSKVGPKRRKKEKGIESQSWSPQFTVLLEVLANQTRKRNKRNPNWKGGSKTVIVCRWHDSVHRKSYRLHQKPLNLINEFGKTAGYNVNTQKSKVFLYTNNELSETEIRGKTHLIWQ